MERGEETDCRWWCVLFLVQVKTLQNGNGGWALHRIEWLVNASSKDATQEVPYFPRVRVLVAAWMGLLLAVTYSWQQHRHHIKCLQANMRVNQ